MIPTGSGVQFNEYKDIERFRLSDGALGSSVVQLDRGALRLRNWQVALDDILIRHYSTNLSIHYEYTSPDDWLSLFIDHQGPASYWCGTEIPGNCIAIMAPGREHDLTTAAGYQDLHFMIPMEVVRKTDLVPERLIERARTPESAYLPLPAAAISHLSASSRAYFAGAPGQAIAGPGRELLLDALTSAIDDALHEHPQAGRSKVMRRYRLVRRSVEYVKDHGTGYLEVDTLAGEVHVSRYTLTRAFKDVLGVSPYQYLLRRRLSQARSALMSGRYSTIAQVANAHGFVSHSEFASHYRRLFLERPSETDSSRASQRGSQKRLLPKRGS